MLKPTGHAAAPARPIFGGRSRRSPSNQNRFKEAAPIAHSMPKSVCKSPVSRDSVSCATNANRRLGSAWEPLGCQLLAPSRGRAVRTPARGPPENSSQHRRSQGSDVDDVEGPEATPGTLSTSASSKTLAYVASICVCVGALIAVLGNNFRAALLLEIEPPRGDPRSTFKTSGQELSPWKLQGMLHPGSKSGSSSRNAT